MSMVEAYNHVESCRPSLALSRRAARQVSDFEADVARENDGDPEDFDFEKCRRIEPREPNAQAAKDFCKRVME
eukprot:819890-Amorphochlora_amoeboformis.AAC.1